MQKIDAVEPGAALGVDHVAKVPTHEIVDFGDGTSRHVAGVVGVFRRDNGFGDVFDGELFHFRRKLQERAGIEGFSEQVANALGSTDEFINEDGRGDEALVSGLHLPPKLNRGFLPLVVEVATQNGGIEVEGGCAHIDQPTAVRGPVAMLFSVSKALAKTGRPRSSVPEAPVFSTSRLGFTPQFNKG